MLNGPDWAGLHHMGFIVEDSGKTAQRIEAAGGAYFTTLPGGFEGLQAEEKYKDINGVVFDISEHGWVTEPVGKLRKARETVPAE